jgi:hypothetical protein
MKYYTPPKSLVLFLILILINSSISLEVSSSNENSNETSSQYTEAEGKLFSKFSKLANCASKPLKTNCPKCVNPGNGYKFYFFYQTTRINKFNFKFMIHYNDISKKILVSFAGPSVKEHVYIKYIYSAGFTLVKKYKFQVEKEYYQIYFNKLRKILKQKLQKIISSGRKKFQVYFAGHSIGGSLATLAAFDMKQSKVAKNIKVFSLAPLRLGDATYVAMVNSYITVYRIVKKSDYLVRIPNCYFSTTYKMWRCFNQAIVKEFILKPTFPLKVYVSSYLTYYTRTNTILRAAIVYARKRIAVTHSLRKTHIVKRTKALRKHKKIGHKNALRKNKSLLLKKKSKKMKKKYYSIQKVLKNLNHKMHNTKKTLKKFNPKKVQKSSRKITNQLKKLKKKKVGKKSIKKLKNLIKNGKKMNKRKLKKRPALLKKKIKKFFRKVKFTARSLFRRAKNILKKDNVNKYKKVKKTHKKKIHIPKKVKKVKKAAKKIRKLKQLIKPKKSKKSKKVAIKKSVKKLHPIKFFSKKKKTSPILGKSYTYIPATFKVYTPLQTYFTFVYYTQPIGYQIFYNDNMTEFTTCQYVNGISLCEKVISLPLQFTALTHMTYFGINFDKC